MDKVGRENERGIGGRKWAMTERKAKEERERERDRE